MSSITIQTERLNEVEEMSADTASGNDTQALLEKRIRRILSKRENKVCLDCGKAYPRWATLITLPHKEKDEDEKRDESDCAEKPEIQCIGGFCCLECGGAHRRLGTHITFVRSLDLDSLKESEVKALELTGNSVVNAIYEGELPETKIEKKEEGAPSVSFAPQQIKPLKNSDQKTRELFIRDKYEKKNYFDQMAHQQFLQAMEALKDAEKDESSVLSPVASSCSEDTSDVPESPQMLQLQAFTTSPRTLAKLQEYLNPKPKKVKLSKRIQSALRRKKKKEKKGTEETREFPPSIIGVCPNLNVLESRSDEEELDEVRSYCSDTECQSGRRQRRFLGGNSVSDSDGASVKSLMTTRSLRSTRSVVTTVSVVSASVKKRWMKARKRLRMPSSLKSRSKSVRKGMRNFRNGLRKKNRGMNENDYSIRDKSYRGEEEATIATDSSKSHSSQSNSSSSRSSSVSDPSKGAKQEKFSHSTETIPEIDNEDDTCSSNNGSSTSTGDSEGKMKFKTYSEELNSMLLWSRSFDSVFMTRSSTYKASNYSHVPSNNSEKELTAA